MDPASAGHFTTLQLRDGRVQGRDLHLARLVAASIDLYGVAPDVALLRDAVRRALIDAGPGPGDCTLRIRLRARAEQGADVAAGGAGPRAPDHGKGPGDPPVWRTIAAAPAHGAGHVVPLQLGIDIESPRQPAVAPLRLCSHAGPRALPGIKHLALAAQLEARRAARDAGFDDALLVTADGCVAEGTFWNIVFLEGDALVRPDGPALPGVTQRLLQDALAGHPRPVFRTGPVHVAALHRFTAAWALNSTGIQDIASIDGHRFRGDASLGDDLRARLAALPADPF